MLKSRVTHGSRACADSHTCSRTWPRRWSWRSPVTPGSYGTPSRPGARTGWPRAGRFGLTRRRPPSGRWPWPPHAGSSAWRRTNGCGTFTASVGRERTSPAFPASGARPPTAISRTRRSPSARVAATPGAVPWIPGVTGSSSAGTGSTQRPANAARSPGQGLHRQLCDDAAQPQPHARRAEGCRAPPFAGIARTTTPGRRTQAGADAAHRSVNRAAPAGSARQRGRRFAGQAARGRAHPSNGGDPGRGVRRPGARAQAGAPRPLAASGCRHAMPSYARQ